MSILAKVYHKINSDFSNRAEDLHPDAFELVANVIIPAKIERESPDVYCEHVWEYTQHIDHNWRKNKDVCQLKFKSRSTFVGDIVTFSNGDCYMFQMLGAVKVQNLFPKCPICHSKFYVEFDNTNSLLYQTLIYYCTDCHHIFSAKENS